ncbi:MAG: hypothetical protein ABI321_03645 [Polyangia bacterium]
MTRRRYAVWIDHKEAKIFHLGPEGYEQSTLRLPEHQLARNQHERASSELVFHDVSTRLEAADEVLALGPTSERTDFLRYVHEHERDLAPKIVGVEKFHEATNVQLIEYARAYFDEKDSPLRG